MPKHDSTKHFPLAANYAPYPMKQLKMDRINAREKLCDTELRLLGAHLGASVGLPCSDYWVGAGCDLSMKIDTPSMQFRLYCKEYGIVSVVVEEYSSKDVVDFGDIRKDSTGDTEANTVKMHICAAYTAALRILDKQCVTDRMRAIGRGAAECEELHDEQTEKLRSTLALLEHIADLKPRIDIQNCEFQGRY